MIYEAIQYLFPGIRDFQFRVQDDSDGKGPYIAFWNFPEPQPTMDEIAAMAPIVQANQLEAVVVAAIQQRLDNFAQTRSYDGILSACTYATSLIPSFKAEGQYAVEARDSHWAKCYQILADVQNGLRVLPELDEVLAEMPNLVWPNLVSTVGASISAQAGTIGSAV